jgi:hypothetical protein
MINSKYIDVGDRNDKGGYVTIESRFGYRHLAYYDSQTPAVQRVLIGRPNVSPDPNFDGLYVRDRFGKNILTANGLGLLVAGQDQLQGNSVTAVHANNSSDLSFGSSARTQSIDNSLLVTVNVYKGYNAFARLAITDPSGVRYIQFGLDATGESFSPSIINQPVGVVPSSVVSLNVQEIYNFTVGKFPAFTWFNASQYPIARTNPYRLVVLEVKR